MAEFQLKRVVRSEVLPTISLCWWPGKCLSSPISVATRDYEGKPSNIFRCSSSPKLISGSRSQVEKTLGWVTVGWMGRGHSDAHSTTTTTTSSLPSNTYLNIKEPKSFPSKTTPHSQGGGAFRALESTDKRMKGTIKKKKTTVSKMCDKLITHRCVVTRADLRTSVIQ